MPSGGTIFTALRAYLAAAGLAGLCLGLAWAAALHLIAAPDPGPPALRVVATTTISTIILAALPSMAAVFVLRWRAAPRGRGDAIAGAIIALVLSAVVCAMVAGFFADGSRAFAASGTLCVVAAFFVANCVAGACAGYLYQRLAFPTP
ncbi:MAG: hypothetical protein ACK4NP_15100 [Parvularculaceae bacterium]